MLRTEVLDRRIEEALSDPDVRRVYLEGIEDSLPSPFTVDDLLPEPPPAVNRGVASWTKWPWHRSAFRRASEKINEPEFVSQVHRRLSKIFSEFYGISLPPLSESTIRELSSKAISFLAGEMQAGRIKRVSGSYHDFRVGDIVVTRVAGDEYKRTIPRGLTGRITEMFVGENKGLRCLIVSLRANHSGRREKHSYRSEELSSYYPLILVRQLGRPRQTASRVVGRLLRIIYSEMIRNEVDKRFIDALSRSGLILEDRHNEGDFFLNRLQLYRLQNPALAAAYENESLYTSPEMFSPPSERKPHVLRLELVEGCDHNQCTFCGGYKGIPYHAKNTDEFREHFYDVVNAISEGAERIERIFIGGGNALSVDTDELIEALSIVRGTFPGVKRIAIYGRADAIVRKGVLGLGRLAENGLNLVYLGIESGSQSVLDYVKKDTTVDQVRQAARFVWYAGMKLSAMIIPGLGGVKYSRVHRCETGLLLSEIPLDYVTFMCVNAAPDSPYAVQMADEMADGTNRPLTDVELVTQVRGIVQLLRESSRVNVGMYDCGIDQVGRNPVSFHDKLDGSGGRRRIMDICDRYIAGQSMSGNAPADTGT